MIPKIRFRYSWIYDERYRKKFESNGKKYPSMKKIVNYMGDVEKMWKKIERPLLKEITKITEFKWQEKEIICYVVGRTRCFSDPLTICLFKNKNDFIDMLTHELIHQIQTQNQKRNKTWKSYIEKNYHLETRTTKNHILVHAIHKKIFDQFFSKERLKREIKKAKKIPDYMRAWRIVLDEGADNIIKKFREATK